MNHPRDWNRPDLAAMVPDRESILNALGLEPRRSRSTQALDGLALFGAGLLVGAGLGLLFAPKEGSALREEISERARARSAPESGNGTT